MRRLLGKTLIPICFLWAVVLLPAYAQAREEVPEELMPIGQSSRTPFLYEFSVNYQFVLDNPPLYNNEGYSNLYLSNSRAHSFGFSFDLRGPTPFLHPFTAGVGLGVQKEIYEASSTWSGMHPSMNAFRVVPDIHIAMDGFYLSYKVGMGCAILFHGTSFQNADPVYAPLGSDCLTPAVYFGFFEIGFAFWRFKFAIGERLYWTGPFDLDKLSYYKRYQYTSSTSGDTAGGQVLFIKIGFQLFSNSY